MKFFLQWGAAAPQPPLSASSTLETWGAAAPQPPQ